MHRFAKTFIALTIALLFLSKPAAAFDRSNRLGIGMSNELKISVPALSFKIQKNKSFALGGLLGLNTDATDGGYGVGLKFYRNIFDEPQLNFYFTGMGALLSNKVNNTSYSGFQFDLAFGSEFHFNGLNSLGLSVEFGASAVKKKNFAFQTMGNNFIVSGIHFYL